MTVRSTVMLGGLLLLGAAFLATWVGTRRQRVALAAESERLIRSGAERATRTVADVQHLDDLPPPVARYLRLAIRSAGQIEEVRIRQAGTIRTDATTDRWMAFEAEHLVVPPATGFLLNARVQIAPLLHVRVRDQLIDGVGAGHVSLLSAFTISADSGTLEMNSGSLHRYLAEAVWYPTALLPSRDLQWSSIDATRALATLSSAGLTVSLEFQFADNGEVTGIYTPARWGTFPGGYRQVPWEGHFRDYRERDGFLVPTEGEVGWYIDDEWRVVWKGSVTAYHVRTSE
jgi:hypothetical protein